MHDDFLNHFPQEGGGQFFKSKVLSHNPHEFLGVDGGGLRLGKFLLQSGSPVFQFPLLLLIVRRQLHETLVADFAAYIVLIQPLDNAVHFGNACLGLFKLLRGCGGLSLAADFVLLDEQLYKAALMPGGVFRHLPEIGKHARRQKVGADKVCRTVTGTLLFFCKVFKGYFPLPPLALSRRYWKAKSSGFFYSVLPKSIESRICHHLSFLLNVITAWHIKPNTREKQPPPNSDAPHPAPDIVIKPPTKKIPMPRNIPTP